MKNHSSMETFRANVERRLKHLGVTGYAASRAGGKRPGWLGDAVNPKRNPKGVPLDVLDAAAEILGVKPMALIMPRYSMTTAAPDWVEEAIERAKGPAAT